MTVLPEHAGSRLAPTLRDVERALQIVERLRPLVEAHVTPARILRYLQVLCTTPAPSSAASLLRTPVLRRLLHQDEALRHPGLILDGDFQGTGNAVLTTGSGTRKPLWYFAHLDTISYLVQPRRNGRYPLVPFCDHLTETGKRPAQALRYDLATGRFNNCAEGMLESEGGNPFFAPETDVEQRPGDRIVPVAPFVHAEGGALTGHLDNAGGVAALAVAAPVLAQFGVDAMLAFADEEEGPSGTGNQMISRGAARLAAAMEPPTLAVVVDMQQFPDDGTSAPDSSARPGAGAVLSEFSSRARGAVTPPPLYAAARKFVRRLDADGTSVREAANIYTSRSDDVSAMLRTPSVLLLGFPGADRHFDTAFPSAHLSDIVNLSKALAYVSALSTVMGDECDD